MSSQCRLQKFLQGLVSHELAAYLSVFNLFLTQWIMTILSKGCKPDNFGSHYSLKLSFTNILALRGLRPNFVECESFLESNSPDILALYETNLDDSRGYLPSSFNPTGFCYSFICMVSQFMWKKGFLLHWTISKKSVNSYLSFQLALLHSVSCLFFLCRSTSSSSCTHSFWCYFI